MNNEHLHGVKLHQSDQGDFLEIAYCSDISKEACQEMRAFGQKVNPTLIQTDVRATGEVVFELNHGTDIAVDTRTAKTQLFTFLKNTNAESYPLIVATLQGNGYPPLCLGE